MQQRTSLRAVETSVKKEPGTSAIARYVQQNGLRKIFFTTIPMRLRCAGHILFTSRDMQYNNRNDIAIILILPKSCER